MKKKTILVSLVLIVSLFNSFYASVNAKALKVGVVPQFEQRKMFRHWRPILSELEKITGLKFDLVGSSKIPVFEQQFTKGEYDIAYMNPYHILTAYKTQGYLPLVRDSHLLRGVLAVEKNSSIKSVKQLAGKEIAFPSPNALGASLLMRSILIEKFGIAFKSRYVQTHSSVYLHIVKKLVSAGGGVERTLLHQSNAIKNKLRVIYKTPDIVPHPIVVHPRVSVSKRKLIKNGLIKLFNTEKGKKLFQNIPINDLVTTNISDYQSLKKYNLDKYFEH